MKNNDNINHPDHYTGHPSGIECIEVAQYMGFCLGNAVKYIWRDGQKAGEDVNDDLRKAIWYIDISLECRTFVRREKMNIHLIREGITPPTDAECEAYKEAYHKRQAEIFRTDETR